MELSEFKEELSKKLLEFQQKLFDITDLEELKDEVETLKGDLIDVHSDIKGEIDSGEEEEEEEETEEEHEEDDLDHQIRTQEKSFPGNSNSSLLNEQEKLKRELGL